MTETDNQRGDVCNRPNDAEIDGLMTDMNTMADGYQLARTKLREARERAYRAEESLRRADARLDAERQAALDVAINFWWQQPPLEEGDHRPSDSEIAEEWTRRMSERLNQNPTVSDLDL